jgi:hypothetical protein
MKEEIDELKAEAEAWIRKAQTIQKGDQRCAAFISFLNK